MSIKSHIRKKIIAKINPSRKFRIQVFRVLFCVQSNQTKAGRRGWWVDGGGGGLLYNFLVIDPNFMKFDDFS